MAGGCQAQAEWMFAAVLQSRAVSLGEGAPCGPVQVGGRREAEQQQERRAAPPGDAFPRPSQHRGSEEGKPLWSPRCLPRLTHRGEVTVLIHLG